jgi:hypothetical protein
VDDFILKIATFMFASSMTFHLEIEHIMTPRVVSFPSTLLFPILTLTTTDRIIYDDGCKHRWKVKSPSSSWQLFHHHLQSSLVELVEASFSSNFYVFILFFLVQVFIIYFTQEFT